MEIGQLVYLQCVKYSANMFKRPKIYYPKSKIINNLYTKGKEWMFEDGTEYIGFYHKYLDGLVLTEAVYSSIRSKKIIPYSEIAKLKSNLSYNKSNPASATTYISPINVYTLPTLDDYSTGFFKRYFIYRRNLKNIFYDFFEVNETQYKSWKTPNTGINEKLYNAFIIEWKLSGPLRDIVVDGQIKEFGVYDTNRRLVYLNERQFPMISKILTDYTEYSIYHLLTPEKIQKQFGNM